MRSSLFWSWVAALTLGGCSGNTSAADMGTADLAVSSPDIDLATADLVTADLSPRDMTGAPASSVSLVAGRPGGLGNRDDTAGTARFNQPSSAVSDGAGNLYIADRGNHTIRKLVIASGAVTTVAGMAEMYGNADGTGSAARFNYPVSLVCDGVNLYISDSSNYRVRKLVLASGAVTTIAGMGFGSSDGSGSAALFGGPTGMVLDGAGNLYVVDAGLSTIRKIVLASGAVTTIAGTAQMTGSADGTGTAARFNSPHGVALDGTDNLYVTDTFNHTIRKIVLSTGMVTTVAGSAGIQSTTNGMGTAARFAYPYDIVSDGTGNLYTTEVNNRLIRKLVTTTAEVTTLAGSSGGSADGTGAAAQFYNPNGISSDGNGSLYVAEGLGHTIRKVVIATAVVTTIAGAAPDSGVMDGTDKAQFNGPIGAASDGVGNLYVADSLNHLIRQVVLATGAVTTVAGSGSQGTSDGIGAAARFSKPASVTLDGAGNVYVADTGNHSIRRIVPATRTVTTYAGRTGSTGYVDGTGVNAGFNAPAGVVYDGTGNLFITDTGNRTIRRIELASGAVTTLAGTAGIAGNSDGTGAAARFDAPSALTSDGAGNLYIVDGSSTIRKLVIATGVVTTTAGAAGMIGSSDGIADAARFSSPRGITSDGRGSLYVTDSGNSTIRRITQSSGAVTTWLGRTGVKGLRPGPAPAGLNRPTGVTLLPTGVLIVVDEAENAVVAVR